jgi:hypothetical protein
MFRIFIFLYIFLFIVYPQISVGQRFYKQKRCYDVINNQLTIISNLFIMEPQARRKSNIFAYVLLGLIIFIIMILVFGKQYSLRNPNLSSKAKEDAVIEALKKDKPGANPLSEEQQAKVIAKLKQNSDTSNSSVSAEQEAKIMEQLKKE